MAARRPDGRRAKRRPGRPSSERTVCRPARHWAGRVATGLVVGLVLTTVAAAGVAGTPGPESVGDAAVDRTNESRSWLPDRQVQVRHGNTTSFDIDVPESASGPLTLSVGGDEHTYELVARLSDDNGDGTVTVEYSAGVANPESSSFAAVGDDEATVLKRENLTRDGWDARAYGLILTSGPEPGGERLDAESLAVVFDPSLSVNNSTDDTDDVSAPADGTGQAESASDGWFSTRTPAADVDEIANIQVALQPEANGSVTLTLGDGEDYRLVATLHDRSGDGVVWADFDVSAAGTDESPISIDGGDEVTLHRQTTLPEGGLTPGDYELNLTLGRPPAGEEVAIGTLVVHSRDNSPDGTNATVNAAERGDEWNWGNRRNVIPNGGIVTAHGGQTAHIPVAVRPGTSVTLVIQRPGTPDDYVVAVEDTDGSGRVPLLFRTGAVDTGSHRVAVQGDNEVTLLDGASDTDPIADGLVSIDVYNGSGLRYDDDGIRNEQLGVGTLQFLERNGTDEGPTATPTPGPSIGGDGPIDDELGALAAIAVGGILAVVGVAVLFGVRRQ